MFELLKAPSGWDPETNSVIAGKDRVTLFAGAILALRELSSQDKFSETNIAVASSTSKRDWATDCLQLLEVRFYLEPEEESVLKVGHPPALQAPYLGQIAASAPHRGLHGSKRLKSLQ